MAQQGNTQTSTATKAQSQTEVELVDAALYGGVSCKAQNVSLTLDQQGSTFSCAVLLHVDFGISLKDVDLFLGKRNLGPIAARVGDAGETRVDHKFDLKVVISQSDLPTLHSNNALTFHFDAPDGTKLLADIPWHLGNKPRYGKITDDIPSLPEGIVHSFWKENKRGGTTLVVLHEHTPNIPEGEEPTTAVLNASFIWPHFKNSTERKSLGISGTIVIESDFILDTSTIAFLVGEFEVNSNIKIGKYQVKRDCFQQVIHVGIEVPMKDIEAMPIHNVLAIQFVDMFGVVRSRRIKWIKALPKYLALHGPYYVDEKSGLSAFFRQNVGKSTTLTVRHTNVTDAPSAHVKIGLAWAASKVAFWLNPILLFEKTAKHYEESARSVYERFVDDGEKRTWFVIDGETAKSLDVEDRYRAHFLRQHSFKHYLYFFRSTCFLGTEALAHCFELRCQSILVQRKLKSKKNKYVFMQHGVMYMVSLDSPERSSFQKENMPGKAYVVASSELEAKHFTDMAGFKRKDIIVCGLPKFDRSYQNSGADKILIMPTWRPWEFAAMRVDPTSTNYVKMVNRIVEAIPEELQDKVIVAPHPLFDPKLFSKGGTDAGAIESYDELLRDVALLITDYSSIAYDAFYRGANVIFYWEELEDCMAHYGEPTHLMLDEQNAFGPVCNSPDELTEATQELYGKEQDKEFLRRYRRIVEFHDGKNTERFIKFVRKAHILD